jgi:hypothetical protein
LGFGVAYRDAIAGDECGYAGVGEATAKLTPEERAKTIAGVKKQEADAREAMKKRSDT